MAGLLASLHYILVVLALGAAFLSLVLESRTTTKLYKYFYKETPEEREREYIGDLLVQPRNTKEIRAYVLADYLLGRHRKLSEDLFKQREKMFRLGSRMSLLSGFVTGTILALAYVFVAFKGIHGTINPGAVVLVIGAFTSVSGTLGQISSTFVAVDQHTTFLDDYFSFLTIDPLVPVPQTPGQFLMDLLKELNLIMSVLLIPAEPNLLSLGLNLHIRKGELMALVGKMARANQRL